MGRLDKYKKPVAGKPVAREEDKTCSEELKRFNELYEKKENLGGVSIIFGPSDAGKTIFTANNCMGEFVNPGYKPAHRGTEEDFQKGFVMAEFLCPGKEPKKILYVIVDTAGLNFEYGEEPSEGLQGLLRSATYRVGMCSINSVRDEKHEQPKVLDNMAMSMSAYGGMDMLILSQADCFGGPFGQVNFPKVVEKTRLICDKLEKYERRPAIVATSCAQTDYDNRKADLSMNTGIIKTVMGLTFLAESDVNLNEVLVRETESYYKNTAYRSCDKPYKVINGEPKPLVEHILTFEQVLDFYFRKMEGILKNGGLETADCYSDTSPENIVEYLKNTKKIKIDGTEAEEFIKNVRKINKFGYVPKPIDETFRRQRLF